MSASVQTTDVKAAPVVLMCVFEMFKQMTKVLVDQGCL